MVFSVLLGEKSHEKPSPPNLPKVRGAVNMVTTSLTGMISVRGESLALAATVAGGG